MERNPDVPLVFWVDIRDIEGVMCCGIHVQACTICKPNCVLARVVVYELGCNDYDATVSGGEPCCPRHCIGAVVVHVNLHGASPQTYVRSQNRIKGRSQSGVTCEHLLKAFHPLENLRSG